MSTTMTANTIEELKKAFRDGDETSHYEIVKFLATIAPDEDLASRGDKFRALAQQWRQLRGRRTGIEARVREIDKALLGATDKAYRSLLDERASLMAESASLPNQLAEIAKRCTLAKLAWYKRLTEVARAEIARVTDIIEEPASEQFAVKRRLHVNDARVAMMPTLSLDQQSALMKRSDELAAEITPIVAQRSLAQFIITMAEGKAHVYGPDVHIMWDSTHEVAAERAMRQARLG